MTDTFRRIEEEHGRHFAEVVQNCYEALSPSFAAIWAAYEERLEAEREEIVESIPWGD